MKNILITGISTGIGLRTTQYLLEKGFFVFGSVRKLEEAQKFEAQFGANFKALVFDVIDQEAISKAKEIVIKMIGNQGLYALVNNAGIAVTGPLMHIPIEDFERQMAVNLTGVLKVTQAFLPLLGAGLKSSFPPGRIINISSVAGKITTPLMVPYCVSKHALEAMSDGLRRELSIYNIKVILIEPGPIKTAIWGKVLDNKNEYANTDYGKIIKQKLDKSVQKSEASAIPALHVAQLIHKTLISKNPRLRYLIAPKQFFIWLATLLPHRVMDYFISKQLKEAIQ